MQLEQRMLRRGETERGLALDVAKSGIAARIRRVCVNFADAEFAALVDQMAEIEVRYRLRDDWQIYREMPRSNSAALN
jgi:hypothetical protein